MGGAKGVEKILGGRLKNPPTFMLMIHKM